MDGKEHQAFFLISRCEPEYPGEAKANGIEGTVVLDALIDKNGNVHSLSVNSGNPLLVGSAVQAVQRWAYRPTKLNGIPVICDIVRAERSQ